MANAAFGVVLSFAASFGVLGLVTLLSKRGVEVEVSRKLAHILLSNWILLALAVFRHGWAACIPPACFVILNYLSYRKGIFAAIERREGNTPGTVWYAVSLLLLCLAGYSLDMPWIAACGILAMGYGDGLGALAGMRWGKHRFPGAHSEKSLEGTLAVLFFSGLAVGLVCAVYAPQLALRAALACAVPAAAIELYSPRGIDNLTLPLGVSLIVFLLARLPAAWPVLACLSLTLFILLAAYYLRALTFWGLQAATLLGVLLFAFGGWPPFAALVLFFLLGSAVSRLWKDKKAAAHALHERRGPRAAAQVAANVLPALIFAALYAITRDAVCLLAVFTCFAAAAADTFSSEIGMASKKDPVSILTLRPVSRGISGGVTRPGFAGAALGALIMSFLALPLFGITGMAAVLFFGMAGSVIDSVLGAALQAKYRLPDGGLTERKTLDGVPLNLARGIPWVNNDIVNFASILLAGVLSLY